MVAMQTGLRYSELRLLRWSQIDFLKAHVTVGQSKTTAGTGLVVPLNPRALNELQRWGPAGSRPATEPLRLPNRADWTRRCLHPSSGPPYRQREDRLGDGETSRGRDRPIPRHSAHRLHADARRRGTAFGRRHHPRLVSGHHGNHGQAVRPHRRHRTPYSRGRTGYLRREIG